MGGEDMTNKQKQTSIDEFKQFVRRHPKLIQEVQTQEKSWQSLYENWVMFGEEDEMWSPYRQSKSEDAKEEKASKPSETGKADFMSKEGFSWRQPAPILLQERLIERGCFWCGEKYKSLSWPKRIESNSSGSAHSGIDS